MSTTEVDTGRRDGIANDERERIKDLEREVRELRRTNEILRKASAFFAQAEARPPTEVMVALVDEHRDEYGVEPICKVLPIAPSDVAPENWTIVNEFTGLCSALNSYPSGAQDLKPSSVWFIGSAPTVLSGRAVVQGTVRPVIIVVLEPFIQSSLDIREGQEPVLR